MNLRVKYFAVLREQAGLSEEAVSTSNQTAGAVYQELRARYGFHLNTENLRVAVNGRFAALEDPLTDGDELVFIPPVAGG